MAASAGCVFARGREVYSVGKNAMICVCITAFFFFTWLVGRQFHPLLVKHSCHRDSDLDFLLRAVKWLAVSSAVVVVVEGLVTVPFSPLFRSIHISGPRIDKNQS